MKRILNEETIKCLGKKVKVCGWVNSIRSHGKIIFIDLRDGSGILQAVFTPEKKSLYEESQTLKPEWVVCLEGKVKERPKGMHNPKVKTGKVELEVEDLIVLNQSKTPPFEITSDTKAVKEEIRLKYRYLDLRTERMRKNLIFRHKVIKYIRGFMDKNGFIEIETPILTKSTPEGARDFIIPSRLHPGKFYALPQSPQQYKQLLQIAGFEKYFQIAKCLRDEDPRADRQAEHTQLDVEMSFVEQEDILSLIEELYVKLVKSLTPQKKITKIPFPRLDYDKTMKQYGTDKPDLRKNPKNPDELAFCWILNWPLFEWNKDEKRYDSMHHIFTLPQEKDIPLLNKNPLKVHSWQHDLVLNGSEIGGGSIRINNREIQEKIFKLIGLDKKEAQKKFGHLLKAFDYGAPPEGGIALGIERLLSHLANEDNIREVMAFPKTGDGWDPLMDSPSEISQEQLKELHIKIFKPKK
ncbi:aspartate--tRNA ligase [Patescibacteria group bacterium]